MSYVTPKRYEIVCLPHKKFRPTFGVRLISVCSLFLERKLDQTDTSSDQSGDDENEPQPAKKAVKRKKESKVKGFMFWKGVGYS